MEHEDRSGGRVPLLLSRGCAFPATAVQHVRLSGPIHCVGILYRPHSSIVGSARSRVCLVFTTGLANMAGRKPWKLISLDHRICISSSRCHSPIQGFLPAMAGVWRIDLGGALEFGDFRSTDGLQPSKKVPACSPFSGGTNSCTHARVSDLDSAIEMLENAELGRSTARPGGEGHSISSNACIPGMFPAEDWPENKCTLEQSPTSGAPVSSSTRECGRSRVRTRHATVVLNPALRVEATVEESTLTLEWPG